MDRKNCGSYMVLAVYLAVFVSLLTVTSGCLPIVTETSTLDDLTLLVTGTDLEVRINRAADVILTAKLGLSLPVELGQPIQCSNGDICWHWGTAAELAISKSADGVCYDVAWRSQGLKENRDCFDLGSAAWFSGCEEYDQHFPMRADSQRRTVPLLPGDMLQDKDMYFGGVAEPWWINSKGVGIWVPEGVPLFYSWNEDDSAQMCLASKHEAPYVASPADPDSVRLDYKICAAADAKAIQVYGAKNLLGLPAGIPDERMISKPIWSTWALYKTDINDTVVMGFANDILSNGFDNSQLEIDDNWESCYGDATFSQSKFPDAAGMVSLLKFMGFRVTLWIHPFVNVDCASWDEVAFSPQGYFVQDAKDLPGSVSWWQSQGKTSGYIDFTNQRAVDWWRARLEQLRTTTGVDSFKFDAGEANWLPASIKLSGGANPETWPAIFTTRYAESMSLFGGMIEVRVARRTQRLPIFVRMLDKFSGWGYDNGLKTMVTTLLQMGIAGYPFVLPDMIGGNGYGNSPSRELFIRWLQANVFMPSMQYSYVPWLYDQQVVAHSLEMTALHLTYSPTIIALAEAATTNGEPINRPIWWLDPTDETALSIDSEFLLGDDLLVAPVLEEGAVSRDIYLPVGSWRDEADSDHPVYDGPIWLRTYPADLYTLPYFTRV